jgi:predicted amidohydrolase
MTRTRALATAQTLPVRGDVDANVEQHLELARIAAAEKARVLVFPELSLTGYELDLAKSLAFEPGDVRLAPLVDAAASLGLTLVAGAPARVGARLHLGAFILKPDRGIELYTKHHLGAFPASASAWGSVPPPESAVFEAGELDPLLALGGETAAVAICADTGRPSHPEAAAARGARIYLASMFVIPPDLENDLANLRTWAVRHSLSVVFANFGGPSGGLPAAGKSAIWCESSQPLVQLPAAGAGVAVAIETASGWHIGKRMLAGGAT